MVDGGVETMGQSGGIGSKRGVGQYPGDVVELDAPLLPLQFRVLVVEHLENVECRCGLFGEIVGRVGLQQ